ncbi:hypothetical protein H920_00162 [Fukomys damarensis]|uniref:Uncharacterized protein n=1 Tax=Fukomys damarensis TaxID=885580 RepID=A0A091E6M3_FUKDA|nr:hypothetical protein H920_00162 [Fukomys damarensis]
MVSGFALPCKVMVYPGKRPESKFTIRASCAGAVAETESTNRMGSNYKRRGQLRTLETEDRWPHECPCSKEDQHVQAQWGSWSQTVLDSGTTSFYLVTFLSGYHSQDQTAG